VPTSKIATPSGHTDRCETVFVKRKGVVMIGDSTRDRKGKFVAEVGLSKPEGFGLEVS
jgi:hypothetical protein